MPQNIKPIAYQRDDKVESLKIRAGWVIRYLDGLCWFYHPVRQEWMVSAVVNLHGGLEAVALPFEDSMKLLETVEIPKMPPRAAPPPVQA